MGDMYGPLICYATHCTEGLTAQDFILGLLIAAGFITGLHFLLKWLIPDDRDKD